MALRVDGKETQLPGKQLFNVVVEGAESISKADLKLLSEFQTRAIKLQRAVSGSAEVAASAKNRTTLLKRAALEVEATPLASTAAQLEMRLDAFLHALRGTLATSDTPPPSIAARVGATVQRIRFSTGRPTLSQIEQLNIAEEAFKPVAASLRTLIEAELPKLESELEKAGAPLTPGRLPSWNDTGR